ncbi:LacI family DNA-binding transcriptional regulator [Piscinibacter sp.]|jgi:LacI family transcriptional regulator|uniref:LacI family DNA-binding transcriptional regulator n=1 Tax=Piscinibacter sp. TaxID=1903157 RepID=UPI002F404526
MAKSTAPRKNATILDVASAAGVSKSTVSLVLNGSPLIKEETAARVREVAARVGYVYNRRAAQMRSQSSNVIGVVINDLMNPFFAEVLVGIERKLVEAGFITLMAHTNESVELQTKVMQSMREQNAAGLILCPALGTPATLVKEVQAWGIPLVVMVRSLGKGSYDYAGSDNALGTFMATNHLLEKGHRRIGFLGGQSGAVFNDRLEGYRAAMKKHRLKEHPELLCPALPTRQGGYEALQRLLDVEPQASAAVCYNDITALGALAALGERGIAVGRDFAIMGFDGLLDTAHSNPPLSTVDIRPGALGEAAASLMLERLSKPNTARLRYVATPELLLRASA